MKAKMIRDFTDDVQVMFEHSVDIGDYSYLILFGRHINGGFICIPNYNIGIEAACVPDAIGYNTDQLVRAGLDQDAAKAIATYIDGYINQYISDLTNKISKAKMIRDFISDLTNKISKSKIIRDFTDDVNVIFEHRVDIGDYSYLILFGRHINGGLICIPDRNIGIEAACVPDVICYNTDRLVQAGLNQDVAWEIATYIDGYIKDHAN